MLAGALLCVSPGCIDLNEVPLTKLGELQERLPSSKSSIMAGTILLFLLFVPFALSKRLCTQKYAVLYTVARYRILFGLHVNC